MIPQPEYYPVILTLGSIPGKPLGGQHALDPMAPIPKDEDTHQTISANALAEPQRRSVRGRSGVKRYMLDTNIVSLLIRRQSTLVERVQDHSMSSLCVSAITAGELAFGLARRPEVTRLKIVVDEFLLRVDVLPWDGAIAEVYGALRARMEIAGKNLAPLDRLIAAHALGAGTVLVTNDRAFGHVPDLQIEDWTTPTRS